LVTAAEVYALLAAVACGAVDFPGLF